MPLQLARQHSCCGVGWSGVGWGGSGMGAEREPNGSGIGAERVQSTPP